MSKIKSKIRSIDDEWDIDLIEVDWGNKNSFRIKHNVIFNGNHYSVLSLPNLIDHVVGQFETGIVTIINDELVDGVAIPIETKYHITDGKIHNTNDAPAVVALLNDDIFHLCWYDLGVWRRTIGPKAIKLKSLAEQTFTIEFNNVNKQTVQGSNIWIKKARELLHVY